MTTSPQQSPQGEIPVKSGTGLGDIFMYAVMLAATPVLSHRFVGQLAQTNIPETALTGGVTAVTVALAAIAAGKAAHARPLSALTAALFAGAVHVGGMAGIQDARTSDWRGGCFDYGAEMIGLDIYDGPDDPVPVCNIYDFKS